MRLPRWATPGVLIGVCSLLVAGAADAQAPLREGFWLEGGWGTGTVRSWCAACTTMTAAYGTSTHLRGGGAVGSRVLLGLEIFALRSSDLVLGPGASPVDAENGSIGPVVMWYVGQTGLFLKGGVGLARGTFTVRSSSGAPVTTERTGSSIAFGAGFDVALASRLAFTVNLGMNIAAIGDASVDGTAVRDIVATIYEAGVGLTLR